MSSNQLSEAAFQNGELDSRSSLDLRSLLVAAWRGKWVLAISCIACLAACAFYVEQAARVYRVTARLLLEERGLPLERRTPSRDSAVLMATQAEIVRSRVVVEGASSAFPAFVKDPAVIDPVFLVISKLEVKPLLGSNVALLTFDCPDAKEGEALLNAIIASYRAYMDGLEHDTQQESFKYLTRSEEDLRKEFDAREKALLELRQENPGLGAGSGESGVTRDLLDNLGQKLTDIKTRRVELESEYKLAMAAKNAPVQAAVPAAPQRGDKPGVTVIQAVATAGDRLPQARSQLGHISNTAPNGIDITTDLQSMRMELSKAQARESEMLSTFGPRFPGLDAVRSEIAIWEDGLRQALEDAPNILNQKVEAAKRQEEQLAELYAAEMTKIKASEGFALKEQFARDGLARLQVTHGSVVGQLQQWHLANPDSNGSARVKVSVLEAPASGPTPVWPLASLLYAISGTIGLVGGLGLVLAMSPTPSAKRE